MEDNEAPATLGCHVTSIGTDFAVLFAGEAGPALAHNADVG